MSHHRLYMGILKIVLSQADTADGTKNAYVGQWSVTSGRSIPVQDIVLIGYDAIHATAPNNAGFRDVLQFDFDFLGTRQFSYAVGTNESNRGTDESKWDQTLHSKHSLCLFQPEQRTSVHGMSIPLFVSKEMIPSRFEVTVRDNAGKVYTGLKWAMFRFTFNSETFF